MLMDNSSMGIDFENNLPYTEEFNTYTYRNFYNGGGIALGDINNDGLLDIYFTGNIQESKLYLNKGDWKFEDITDQSGLACTGSWSTGASFIDINADGLLDVYVCKAGKPGGDRRHNELFINQGNLQFVEQSKEYGLDIEGMSVHSAFFDYDKDGDLDCYLLNNSIRSVGGFDLKEGLRDIPDPEGNKFFENQNGKFVDVTQEAGLYSSNIGYGLGITLSDFNGDSWPDIFISNDFFERDYLYINNGDKTFTEVGDDKMASMSMGSMGADACDIDNDLKPDLFVTEMLPTSLERKKTKAQYETWDKYSAAVSQGYHHQFTRNVLQRNIGEGKFLEVGRMAGVASTEWSWASLIQDFDNDGFKDLFVSNGIYKDLLDKDYLNYSANDAIIKSGIQENKKVITMLVDSMPSKAIHNFMYKNKGNFQFEDVSEEWGFGMPTFSNGSAYGDLDNDGDLDIVVNNVNMPSMLFQNQTDTSIQRSLTLKLSGTKDNTKAIGTKVIAKYNGQHQMIENYTSKGFQSTITHDLHIGLGNHPMIDTLILLWPNGGMTTLRDVPTNQRLELDEKDAIFEAKADLLVSNEKIPKSTFQFKHKDIRINQFARERLLFEMNGNRGPALSMADINGDSIEDLFCGGGRNQADVLFLSTAMNDAFTASSSTFDENKGSETTASQFFDSDNDSDLDLYIASGGATFSIYAPELNDRLYTNDGKGNFTLAKDAFEFPYSINTSDITIGDINNDGLKDVVIAEQMKNSLYGLKGGCHIYINKGENKYVLQTPAALKEIGLLTDVELMDIDNDGYLDIVMAGKWMPITIVYNNKGTFQDAKTIETASSSGLWETLYQVDLNQDGKMDLVAGNLGENNFFSDKITMYVNDFDQNGRAEQIICESQNGKDYPIQAPDELYTQMPILKKKFQFYNDFAKVSIDEMFEKEIIDKSIKYQLDEMKSVCFLNFEGEMKRIELPKEIQYSSVHAIHSIETQNGLTLFFGGNNYQIKPQFGRQDASLGWKMNLSSSGDSLLFEDCVPLHVEGQIRSFQTRGNSRK